MNAVTSTAFLASDPIAASLEALLAHSAPSTPGSVSDNDEVRNILYTSNWLGRQYAIAAADWDCVFYRTADTAADV